MMEFWIISVGLPSASKALLLEDCRKRSASVMVSVAPLPTVRASWVPPIISLLLVPL